MRIELDPDLASRLVLAARQLGRKPEDCARAAILDFVTDCEETARLRSRLGGGDHWVRDEDWSD
ncbi:conserved hypothetical protein [Candidatus Terasakiella magnetica]|nr:conserved hypothetical protein [Candidatus Terasakiella magnetica]